MNTDKHGSDVDEITEKIIGCAFKVSSGLGVGFLEKVYENALLHEIRKTGMSVQQQVPLKVMYDGIIVGDYFADLLVQNTVVVELKHTRSLEDAHIAQCINYLRATSNRIGLLLNFGQPKLQIKRLIQD